MATFYLLHTSQALVQVQQLGPRLFLKTRLLPHHPQPFQDL